MLKKSDLALLAQRLNGIPVHGTLPGSPADRAGIRYGDVLLLVDGMPTPTWDDYLEVRRNSGASLELRLFRDGEELDVTLELDKTLGGYGALSAALGLWDGDGSPS